MSSWKVLDKSCVCIIWSAEFSLFYMMEQTFQHWLFVYLAWRPMTLMVNDLKLNSLGCWSVTLTQTQSIQSVPVTWKRDELQYWSMFDASDIHIQPLLDSKILDFQMKIAWERNGTLKGLHTLQLRFFARVISIKWCYQRFFDANS